MASSLFQADYSVKGTVDLESLKGWILTVLEISVVPPACAIIVYVPFLTPVVAV